MVGDHPGRSMHRTRGSGNPAPAAASTRQQLLNATAVLRQLPASKPANSSQTAAQLQLPLASAVWPRSPVMKSLLLACLSGPWWCLLGAEQSQQTSEGWRCTQERQHCAREGQWCYAWGSAPPGSSLQGRAAQHDEQQADWRAAPRAPKQAAHPLPLAASRCSCLSDTPLGCCCTCRGAVSTLRRGRGAQAGDEGGEQKVAAGGWAGGSGGGRRQLSAPAAAAIQTELAGWHQPAAHPWAACLGSGAAAGGLRAGRSASRSRRTRRVSRITIQAAVPITSSTTAWLLGLRTINSARTPLMAATSIE